MLVSAGYDATVRVWPLAGSGSPIIVTLPSALNAVAVAPDGEITAAGADGRLFFVVPAARSATSRCTGIADHLALALAGRRAGCRRRHPRIGRDHRPQDPHDRAHAGRPRIAGLVGGVLSGQQDAADRRHRPDGAALGCLDRRAYRRGAAGNDDPLAAYAGDRGAEIYRACIACHTLSPDEGNRAGPTLAGIFGRRIATLPGYNFSDALKKLDIVWTPETVSKLFEIGPTAYTPGTKMPEQTIGSA